jgi:hypothetical protein
MPSEVSGELATAAMYSGRYLRAIRRVLLEPQRHLLEVFIFFFFSAGNNTTNRGSIDYEPRDGGVHRIRHGAMAAEHHQYH